MDDEDIMNEENFNKSVNIEYGDNFGGRKKYFVN
jgi:hypothetical protein